MPHRKYIEGSILGGNGSRDIIEHEREQYVPADNGMKRRASRDIDEFLSMDRINFDPVTNMTQRDPVMVSTMLDTDHDG